MADDGETKDDVKMPDSGEVAEKINKLFKVEEKDTSKFNAMSSPTLSCRLTRGPKMLSSSLPWARRLLLMPRRLPAALK
jgi:hypothetical protein